MKTAGKRGGAEGVHVERRLWRCRARITKTRARGGDQPAHGAGGQRTAAARAASSGTGIGGVHVERRLWRCRTRVTKTRARGGDQQLTELAASGPLRRPQRLPAPANLREALRYAG